MTGPNAEPKPAHAHSTSAMMPPQFGSAAMKNATTEMSMTMMRPAHCISWSVASLRMTGL